MMIIIKSRGCFLGSWKPHVTPSASEDNIVSRIHIQNLSDSDCLIGFILKFHLGAAGLIATF